MRYGYPQDWILTLKHRIRRVHVKGYKFLNREGGQVVGLHEGDVNWKEVLSLLSQVGYRSVISAEFSHDKSDPSQLLRISKDLDRLLES
jgi:sugar phosphate isomerase/epimerase